MSESQTDAGSPEPFLLMKEIGPFIRQQTGIPVSTSTVQKACSPAIGDGPKPAAWFGRRPLYARADVLAWAQARLSAEPRRSAHNLPPKAMEAECDNSGARKRRGRRP